MKFVAEPQVKLLIAGILAGTALLAAVPAQADPSNELRQGQLDGHQAMIDYLDDHGGKLPIAKYAPDLQRFCQGLLDQAERPYSGAGYRSQFVAGCFNTASGRWQG